MPSTSSTEHHDTRSAVIAHPGRAFVLGLFCGVAAGAAAGLLFAPKSGDALRQDMADQAARLKMKAAGAYDQSTHAVADVVDRGRRAWEAGKEAMHAKRPNGAAKSHNAETSRA